ncbi:hypothetical protein LTR86_000721 [Recurvomyces mirabilis]|nr:hypothetical protein LTR86_000721 [Recurvomyces mirabilis]
MKYTIATAAAAFAGLASARHCQNLTVEVDVSARNGLFNVTTPQDNIAQGKNYSANVLEGYQTVSGKYHIAATYCQPDSGPAKTVQLLTHGIGFDRSYWDLPYANYNYSYVAEAVDTYKYSTFSWDRLGIAQSQHGEAVNEIQALLEVDALRALTQDLRKGGIWGVPCGFDKVVHVGHSFGSEHTYALTAMYPTISDGIALTGFSQNGSFIPYFAFGGNFISARNVSGLAKYNYPAGYLAAGDISAVQTNFFAPGSFDPAVLSIAYTTGQPVTVGELLTIGGETGSINHFKGPTFIITGERDLPYCGGNCLAPPTGYSSIPAAALKFFPNATNPTAVVVPGAGHGLNLEYSHPFTYGKINDYFVQNGVGPNA